MKKKINSKSSIMPNWVRNLFFEIIKYKIFNLKRILSFQEIIENQLAGYFKKLDTKSFKCYVAIWFWLSIYILSCSSIPAYIKWLDGIILFFLFTFLFNFKPFVWILMTIHDAFEEGALECCVKNFRKNSNILILCLIPQILICCIFRSPIFWFMIYISILLYACTIGIEIFKLSISTISVFDTKGNISKTQMQELQANTKDSILPPIQTDLTQQFFIENKPLLYGLYDPEELTHGYLPFFFTINRIFYASLKIPRKSEHWFNLIEKTTGCKRKSIKETWNKKDSFFTDERILRSIIKTLNNQGRNFDTDKGYECYKNTINDLYNEFQLMRFRLNDTKLLQFNLFCYLYLFYIDHFEEDPIIPKELNDFKLKDSLWSKIQKLL